MKLTLAPGTKLKDAPLGLRLLLYLVGIAERHRNVADLEAVALALGDPLPATMQALDQLTKDQHIVVESFNPPTAIVFSVPKETRNACYKDAASLWSHLQAVAERAAHPKPPKPGLPNLPPIEEAERAKQMKAAAPLAAKLLAQEKEHAAWKIAGCIVRLGKPAVAQMVEQTCAQKHEPRYGAFHAFFQLYCHERNERFRAAQTGPGA